MLYIKTADSILMYRQSSCCRVVWDYVNDHAVGVVVYACNPSVDSRGRIMILDQLGSDNEILNQRKQKQEYRVQILVINEKKELV